MKTDWKVRPGQHQPGFALITGLLLLIVLSLIGLTTLNVTRLETLMAGSAREAAIAFQAAEAGLRDAEGSVQNTGTCTLVIPATASGSGTYGQLAVEPDYITRDWTSGTDFVTYVPNDYPEMQANMQPRHVTKHLGATCIVMGKTIRQRCLDPACPSPTCGWISDYRVTAWGTSRDATSTNLLQTHVACFEP
jgi:type IV pilus assembly protein PilX